MNHGKAWGKYLCVFQTEDTKKWVYVASPYWDLKNMPDFENSIDCGTNEELFLAIAALRDDSDNLQWFTDGNGYWQLCIGKFRYPNLAYEKVHKATVEELIEHFKDKEG